MKPEHYQMLAEAKLTVEQIGVVMRILSESEDAMKAAEGARKAVARERVQRWRDKKKAGETLQKHNGDATVRLTRVEDSSSKKDNNKEEKKESAAAPRGVDEFRAELSLILDTERLDAIVAVRRKKGAVFSAHAGRLLSKALLECPDVNAAADEMVLRNWTGIKPDWLAKRTATGPPRKPNAVDAMQQIFAEKGWTENEPEILPSPDSDAQRLSSEQRRPSGPVVDLRPGADWHR